jgi:hypothetical protein
VGKTIKSGNSYGSGLDALTTMANNQSNQVNSNNPLNQNNSNSLNNLNNSNNHNNKMNNSNIPIDSINYQLIKSKHVQSRNHFLNINNYTNNLKNSYAQDSSLKQPQGVYAMRTYSGGQHVKSNSMGITSYFNYQNNNSQTVNQAINNPMNNINSQNIQIKYKKVQPKIIKNNNYSIQGKLPSNYIEILNKRKTDNSRNNYILGNDFMRVGNNTKNNVNSIARSKFINGSVVYGNNSTGTGLNNLNISNIVEKERANSRSREMKVSSQILIQNQTQQNNINNQANPHHKNTLNMNNININIHTNGHSRNQNYNEISSISDLTSSINRGQSIEESNKKNTNVIVKPKINISFVHKMVSSLESINNTLNINNSQTYADPEYVTNNKKSRNDRVDVFFKNNTNTNKTMKTIKNNNFKSMLSTIQNSNANAKAKSRNIKNHYSINFDTLSKGNTIEKDKDDEYINKKNISEVKESSKMIRNTLDVINYENLNNKSPVNVQNKFSNSIAGLIGSDSRNVPVHGKGQSHSQTNSNVINKIHQSNANSNPIQVKDKDNSLINSNYMFLKKKINSIKICHKQGKFILNF